MGVALQSIMHVNPKHDAQKTDVTRKDGAKPPKSEPKPRPRQDSLDRERAAGEGMIPPEKP